MISVKLLFYSYLALFIDRRFLMDKLDQYYVILYYNILPENEFCKFNFSFWNWLSKVSKSLQHWINEMHILMLHRQVNNWISRVKRIIISCKIKMMKWWRWNNGKGRKFKFLSDSMQRVQELEKEMIKIQGKKEAQKVTWKWLKVSSPEKTG